MKIWLLTICLALANTENVTPKPEIKSTYTATAYCLRGRTASGTRVRSGIVAADPRLHRLGTRIALHNTGGYDGTYLVADTGAKIKGRKLDIWMGGCKSAIKFGRKTVGVRKV